MSEEVLKRLDALAAKLGTTGEHMWSILVAQARIEAVISLIEGVALLVCAVWLFRKVNTAAAAADEFDKTMIYSLGWSTVLISAVAGVACLEGVRWFFMPEAWALQQILSTIK